MKKALLLAILLLMGLVLLSACGTPEPTEPEATPTEVPTEPPPTFVAPTPVPTITPIPMEGVEWPSEGATLLSIDPIDKPTRPPIIFEPYVEYVSPSEIGVRFQYPAYWEEPSYDGATGYLTIREPATDIRSGTGVASEVTIMMQEYPTAQTERDAQNALDSYLDHLRGIHPTLTASSSDTNSMMGSAGKYVTYRYDHALNEDGSEVLKMRGRILVVPKDKRLYTVQYLCPAEWNSDYVNVYYTLRSTMEEL